VETSPTHPLVVKDGLLDIRRISRSSSSVSCGSVGYCSGAHSGGAGSHYSGAASSLGGVVGSCGNLHGSQIALAGAAMSGDRTVTLKPQCSKYVKLNVGGTLFYTTMGTLTKHDNMLRAMFSGHHHVLTDPEGWILIERSGKHFGTVLNYLRDGAAPLPEQRQDLEELLAEAKYYCVKELETQVEEALRLKDDEVTPICRVPLITSSKEELALLAASQKPVIKLLCNRHNNKYSYTSTSDDNLLKNIELFDKLCIRFHGRILFIKDVIGSQEICCWTFYGHKNKVAEVCCTSIVYATERKQTKVEFPEARIYEETLNVLLFEEQDHNPVEIPQPPSNRAPTSDDEDTERMVQDRVRRSRNQC